MPLHYSLSDGIAHVELDHPPVNALGLELRRALVDAFAKVDADDAVQAVVLSGRGKGFCAGGDRTEFGTPAAVMRPTLSRDVLSRIESCRKPVIAALHGFAVGGGLELALACSGRVAVAGTRFGLPEVTIGRFPLSGSQRLPRIVGIARATTWMMRGEMLSAGLPDAAALFDRVVDHEELLVPASLDLARASIFTPLVPARSRPLPDRDPRAALQAVCESYPEDQRSTEQRTLLLALWAAVESPDFSSGLDRAQQLFDDLVYAQGGAPS